MEENGGFPDEDDEGEQITWYWLKEDSSKNERAVNGDIERKKVGEGTNDVSDNLHTERTDTTITSQ